jgi:hypothetical protein
LNQLPWLKAGIDILGGDFADQAGRAFALELMVFSQTAWLSIDRQS